MTHYELQQNQSVSDQRRVLAYLVSSSDGKTAATGITSPTTLKIAKASGSEATGSGTWTEIGNGLYYYQYTASELDTPGPLSLRVAHSGVRTFVRACRVVSSVNGTVIQDDTGADTAIYFRLVSDSDGDTGITGASFSASQILVGKNGAAEANSAGTVTELQDGLYRYLPGSGETYTLGFLYLRIPSRTSGSGTFRTHIAEIQVSEAASVVSEDDTKYRIPIIPEVHLRALLTKNPISGPPKYAAVRPKVSDNTGGQSHEILFYPIPDQSYTLDYRYNRRTARITDATPFPEGTAAHRELVLQSCLAVAELRLYNKRDVHWASYMERLSAAIQLEQQAIQLTENSSWPIQQFEDDDLILTGGDAPAGMSFRSLMRDVGDYLGLGANLDEWTHKEEGEVGSIVRSGVKQFYFPSHVNAPHTHRWSFLYKTTTITTEADEDSYDLPADFAGWDGKPNYLDDASGFIFIETIDERQIRGMKQASSSSVGMPEFAAIQSTIDIDTNDYQIYVPKLLLHPTPQAVYDIEIKYHIIPDVIGGTGYDQPVAIGSPVHSETVLASCLCVAERRKKNIANGPQYQNYMERLAASISFDQRAVRGETFGVNLNVRPSSMLNMHERRRLPISFMGNFYP